METFELWSYDVSGELGQYAAHTYIRCPDQGTYFDCWGNHQSPTEGAGILRFTCQGVYEVADCYRRNIVAVKDTAGIGVYGVNGVCHQTANLFLYSTGRAITLADGVKGYGASVLAYGIYGDFNPFNLPAQQLFLKLWKSTVYDPCYEKYRKRRHPGNELFQRLEQLYKTATKKKLFMKPHEMIHREAALLAEQGIPEIDTAIFKDIHLDFLKEKHSLIDTGLKGRRLAEKINDLAAEFQKALAVRIGYQAYEKLTGVEAGTTVSLVDPDIAEGLVA
jgi:hypothetical protein